MQQLTLILHVLSAAALVALILLQQGKGADIGAAFGSGASNTMFGSRGSVSFLTKVTAVLAVVFFVTSLLLGHFTGEQAKQASTATKIIGTASQQPQQQKE